MVTNVTKKKALSNDPKLFHERSKRSLLRASSWQLERKCGDTEVENIKNLFRAKKIFTEIFFYIKFSQL